MENEKNSNKAFYLTIVALLLAFVVIGIVFSNKGNYGSVNIPKPPPKAKPAPPPPPPPPPSDTTPDIEKPSGIEKSSEDLIKDLKKNPHSVGAWQALYENHAKAGDTAAARRAKESYEKAVRNQRVLSSLAKAFGNGVRVEITEDAVFYRTNHDFSNDSEFYHEAARLRDSLNIKFKGKKLIVENYDSKNKVQRIELSP